MKRKNNNQLSWMWNKQLKIYEDFVKTNKKTVDKNIVIWEIQNIILEKNKEIKIQLNKFERNYILK